MIAFTAPDRSWLCILVAALCTVASAAPGADPEIAARVEYYRRAIQAQPSRPELHFQLGMQLWDLGRLLEARDALTEELRLNPSNNRCRVVLGMIEVQQQDYRGAIRDLESALGSDAGLKQAWFPLGQAWYYSGDFEKAREYLERAVQVEAPSATLYAMMSRTYFKLGQSEKAATMSKLHAAARSLALAEAAANLGSWAEADRLVSEFLQAFPDAANGLYVKAGIAFNGFRKLEEATALLERVLARDANNIKARRLLAVLQWTGGNKPAFEKNMELVLAADPVDGQAHYYMGRYRFEKGELTEALEQLETAERLRPFDYRVATDLARTYAAAGRLQQAEEKHRAAVAMLGQWPLKDPLVYTNYAEFLLAENKPAPALELLRRILSVPRPLPRALYLAGVACAAQGKLTEAAQFLKRADESAPGDPQVRLALAEVHKRAAQAGPAPGPQVQR